MDLLAGLALGAAAVGTAAAIGSSGGSSRFGYGSRPGYGSQGAFYYQGQQPQQQTMYGGQPTYGAQPGVYGGQPGVYGGQPGVYGGGGGMMYGGGMSHEQQMQQFFGTAPCKRIYGRYNPSSGGGYQQAGGAYGGGGGMYGGGQPQPPMGGNPYGGGYQQPPPQQQGYGGGMARPPQQGGYGGGGGGGRVVVDQNAVTYRGGVKPIKPYDFPTPYTQGRCKGLFIGINYFNTKAELRGCCNDVAVIIDTLKQLEFPLQEAAILVDDPKFAGASGMPTRDNIIQHMLWLVKDAKAGDCLFFHFSGHGSQTKDYDGDEDDCMDETLVPVDFREAGTICDDDIFEIMVRNLPMGVRMTAIMDCCHSGSLMDLPFSFVSNGDPSRVRMSAGRGLRTRLTMGDVCMFSGCSDSQKSADVSNTAQGFAGNSSYGAGGACTNALSMVLTRTKGLSYAQLVDEMRKVLVSRNFKQMPELSASKAIDLTSQFSFFGTFRYSTHYHLDPGRNQPKQLVPYQPPSGGPMGPPSGGGMPPPQQQGGYQQPPPPQQQYQQPPPQQQYQQSPPPPPQQGYYNAAPAPNLAFGSRAVPPPQQPNPPQQYGGYTMPNYGAL